MEGAVCKVFGKWPETKSPKVVQLVPGLYTKGRPGLVSILFWELVRIWGITVLFFFSPWAPENKMNEQILKNGVSSTTILMQTSQV